MKTYQVAVTITQYGFFTVDAKNEEEAEALVGAGECDDLFINKEETEIGKTWLANDTDIPS